MRKHRVLGPPGATYHCYSRIYDRKHLLKKLAHKTKFLQIMRREAAFCGVEINTYCIMDNHWHMLVTVPPRPSLNDIELAARFGERYGSDRQRDILEQLETLRKISEKSWLQYREKLLARLHDISHFMQMVKQNFSIWYNKKYGRKGTLWEGRFGSVLVEGSGEAFKTMAAYIDLNPVRAAMVKDPKDFRWSGYGAAVAGNELARTGIAQVMRDHVKPDESLAAYRLLLFGAGEEKGEADPNRPATFQKGFSREQALQVYEAEGKLTVPELMSCRVKYLVNGAILGSRSFVQEMYARNAKALGRFRKDPGNCLPLKGKPLFSLRNFSQPLE